MRMVQSYPRHFVERLDKTEPNANIEVYSQPEIVRKIYATFIRPFLEYCDVA